MSAYACPQGGVVIANEQAAAAAQDGAAHDAEDVPRDAPAEPVSPPRPRRRTGWIVALGIGVIALAVGVALLLLELQSMNARMERQQERIEQQERQIEEQKGLIDRKETFGTAMEELTATAREFEGVGVGGLVPSWQLSYLAESAWRHRYDAAAVERGTDEAIALMAQLSTRLMDARSQASGNSTGSVYEEVVDRLGDGFATTSIDDADRLCGADVLGCVDSAGPRTVHIDAAGAALPYMTDWLKTGIAYHEYAHVLQLTNPAPTESALAAFDGDHEWMADCFALTYLDGWSLDHRVWVSSFQYWDVSVGYGRTCDASQQEVLGDWHSQLGYRSEPVAQ
ncbi:hypothetical protein [Microbacterium rhizophilus]|uniref:hypothetical protein n=1 Tax=Microbacterium rhizophilus TaxID=3138934 RepID=UPI0031E6C40C